MAKFEKFNPEKHLRGLPEAARQILAEELIRDGRMPSFDQVVAAIDETRHEYRPRILAACKGEKIQDSGKQEENHE